MNIAVFRRVAFKRLFVRAWVGAVQSFWQYGPAAIFMQYTRPVKLPACRVALIYPFGADRPTDRPTVAYCTPHQKQIVKCNRRPQWEHKVELTPIVQWSNFFLEQSN